MGHAESQTTKELEGGEEAKGSDGSLLEIVPTKENNLDAVS